MDADAATQVSATSLGTQSSGNRAYMYLSLATAVGTGHIFIYLSPEQWEQGIYVSTSPQSSGNSGNRAHIYLSLPRAVGTEHIFIYLSPQQWKQGTYLSSSPQSSENSAPICLSLWN